MRHAVAALVLGLAAAGSALAAEDGRVVLVIDARHRLSVGGVPATPRTVVAVLDRVTGGDHARPLVIRAVPSTRFVVVEDLVARLGRAGYEAVAIEAPGSGPG